MTVDDQFNIINEKLQQLLRQHNRVKKENEQLRIELEGEKRKYLTTQTKIDDLQQQISIVKLGAGDMNDKDKKEFEKKVNSYIKEIDKCINLLSE
jgi:predicted  nucleic acid-binding Zn-ribbon protein